VLLCFSSIWINIYIYIYAGGDITTITSIHICRNMDSHPQTHIYKSADPLGWLRVLFTWVLVLVLVKSQEWHQELCLA
jgi:hypothetical protein